MKDIMKTFGLMCSAAIGYMFGWWVWDNGLEDKLDDFRERLSNKRKEKGA